MAITYDLISYTKEVLESNPVMTAYNTYFYGNTNPNITGYTLVFLVPPDLSGINDGNNFKEVFSNFGPSIIDSDGLTTFLNYQDSSTLLTFVALDYAPPQTQITHAQVSPRTGGIPYATDVTSTENINITYIDNMNNTVYMYHLLWAEYIRAITGGGYWDPIKKDFIPIKPASDYLTEGTEKYGTLDYAASIYIVKYMPDMEKITYIGKAIGAIPVSLPSRELIGNKTSNDLAILPYDYVCGGFREWVHTNNINNDLYIHLNTQIISKFN